MTASTKNTFYSHQKSNITATREFTNLKLTLPLLCNSIIKLASISGIGKDKIHIVFWHSNIKKLQDLCQCCSYKETE